MNYYKVKMNRLITLLILLSACLGAAVAQGVQFVNKSFAEALEQARKENKMLFVDCYTSWCGPCKMLARDVFPQKEVGDFFSSKFVAIQMDMEKGEGPQRQKKWDVNAYPTLIVFNNDGTERFRIVGAENDAHKFIDTLSNSLTKHATSYEVAYKQGDRSKATVLAYIEELKKNYNTSKLKQVLSAYLADNREELLTDSAIFKLFTENITDPHDSLFLWAYKHKADFIKRYGQQAGETLESYWPRGCRQTYIYDGDTFKGYDPQKMDEYEQFMRENGVGKAAVYAIKYKLPCSDAMGTETLLKNLEASASMKEVSSGQWTFFAGKLEKTITDKSMLKRLAKARKQRQKTDEEK